MSHCKITRYNRNRKKFCNGFCAVNYFKKNSVKKYNLYAAKVNISLLTRMAEAYVRGKSIE
jgi:hypothetical protein